MKEIFGVGLGVFLLMVIIYGISWLLTCGIIKLITLCFGWTFKWSIATGLWLIMCIVKHAFSSDK